MNNVDKEWRNYRDEAMLILQREDELKEIVKLVGPEALPDRQRLILETARILRDAFLQQNALDPVDTYCSPIKLFKMLKIIIDFHKFAERIVRKGVPVFKVRTLPVLREIMRMKTSVPNDKPEVIDELYKKLQDQFSELEKGMV